MKVALAPSQRTWHAAIPFVRCADVIVRVAFTQSR